MYVYVSVGRCVHMSVSAYRCQKRVLDAPGAGFREVVCCLMRPLRTKLRL